jgi:pyruvate, orthophosphate dikinase
VKNNPFATIDQQGVGKLMEVARDQAHKSRPHIELGICGEHGGDPESVKFCHRIGLDYVSCSPFRVPVAKLAAAQAALADQPEKITGKTELNLGSGLLVASQRLPNSGLHLLNEPET